MNVLRGGNLETIHDVHSKDGSNMEGMRRMPGGSSRSRGGAVVDEYLFHIATATRYKARC